MRLDTTCFRLTKSDDASKPVQECRRTISIVDRGGHPQEFTEFTLNEFRIEISREDLLQGGHRPRSLEAPPCWP
jgi:hypothetical protein